MKNPTVAIVGGASLLGRELQDLIRDSKLKWTVRLLSGEADGSAGTITASGEDATYLEPISSEALAEADVTFLAGTRESSAEALRLDPAGQFVDLTGVVKDDTMQPLLHPAAKGLALLLEKLKYAEYVIATVFEPASERGHAGVAELQKQSSSLLSFQPLPKDVFDAQAAFNLLAEYGEDAPVSLAAVEDRIYNDLLTLRPDANLSLRLIQTPVFHAYGVLAFVRFPSAVDSIESLFQKDPRIDLRTGGTEAPSTAGAAQQDGFQVGSFRKDRRDPRAWWVWMTFDNLRVAASDALEVAKELL
ncbi:hypothetical protein F183_A19310 [Bryobacterales bacterium F-183]|nr:hypothetical protein F183_A19310 [Bryobacterales bacterium F-183]